MQKLTLREYLRTPVSAHGRTDLIDAMLAKYPDHGNRYTLFAAAFSEFPR